MKRNPIGRLVAVGLVAAITLAVTVGSASAWPPKGSFVIDGKLDHTMLLSPLERALPDPVVEFLPLGP